MPLQHRPRVWACIVAYRADGAQLLRHATALAAQVDQVLLMDNAPGAPMPPWPAGVRYCPMPGNLGTAGALNQAWSLALEAGVDFMASFDQDSLVEPGLVAALLAAYQGAPGALRLAAVGASWCDERTGVPMRVLAPVRWPRRRTAPESALMIADHLITSGCLVPASAYRAVGPFDASLFLDYVDIEWSLRARAQGHQLAVTRAARMAHVIGEEAIRVAGRTLFVHRPQRTYLMVRNHLRLWRLPWIPRRWLLSDLLQLGVKVGGLMVLAPGRRARLAWTLRGLRDGLAGAAGPPPWA